MADRDLILRAVEDLVADFVFYGRKEDEDLPLGAIENAIKNGDISIQQIVDRFAFSIAQRLSD